MKKINRIIPSLLALALMLCIAVTSIGAGTPEFGPGSGPGSGAVYAQANTAGTWRQQGGAWQFVKPDGSLARGGWVLWGNAWYWLKADGMMADGEWAYWDGSWYWLKPGGAMADGEWAYWDGSWYWLKPGGAMAANEWLKQDGACYWLKPSGVMARSELLRIYEPLNDKMPDNVSATLFKFDANGRMLEMPFVDYPDGNNRKDYWLKPDGSLAANEWYERSGTKYWYKEDGDRAENEVLNINGTLYIFDAAGNSTIVPDNYYDESEVLKRLNALRSKYPDGSNKHMICGEIANEIRRQLFPIQKWYYEVNSVTMDDIAKLRPGDTFTYEVLAGNGEMSKHIITIITNLGDGRVVAVEGGRDVGFRWDQVFDLINGKYYNLKLERYKPARITTSYPDDPFARFTDKKQDDIRIRG